MSASVRVLWTCDWCGRTAESWSEGKRPDGWSRFVLTGVAYRPERDLCAACGRAARGKAEAFEALANGFWIDLVRTMHA